jgi:hypothetical protein
MRDIEGKYLSDDVIEAIKVFLLDRGLITLDGNPNIKSIHLSKGLYKIEYTEPNKESQGYLEIPEFLIKSFIRNKKINKIIE